MMLRGVAPNEIPLERPSRFELILNFRTAAELGITFPRNLQLAATDVVR